MVSVTLLIGAAVAAMLGTTAFAADMPQYAPPQPQLTYQPMQLIVAQPEGAWYLRGDIGVGITEMFDITYLPSAPDVGNGFAFDQNSNSDTVFINAGVGYEWNNWLRFDVIAEYRNAIQINARGVYNAATGEGDAYQGYLKSWLLLANAYVDLGTWNCVTPFVGFGVGGAYNEMADLVDMGIGTTGAGFGRNSTNLSPAWAFYAGVNYSVTQNFSVELAYRYLNYGSVTDTVDCIGGCSPDSYKFSNLVSNDFMLGMRWRFPVESGPTYVAQQAPVMMQQAPVYAQPAPVYAPPAPVMMPPAPMMMPQQAPMMMPQQAPMMVPQQAPMMMPQPQPPLSTRG
jgi:opacity protein-like surface antigen